MSHRMRLFAKRGALFVIALICPALLLAAPGEAQEAPSTLDPSRLRENVEPLPPLRPGPLIAAPQTQESAAPEGAENYASANAITETYREAGYALSFAVAPSRRSETAASAPRGRGLRQPHRVAGFKDGPVKHVIAPAGHI